MTHTELKLEAAASQVAEVLTRISPYPKSPEMSLVAGVIAQAWADAAYTGTNKEMLAHQRDALHWFRSGQAGKFAGIIGIDDEAMVELFDNHHPQGDVQLEQKELQTA